MDKFVSLFVKFSVGLKHRSRFFYLPDEELKQAIDQIVEKATYKIEIPSESIFYRARIHEPRFEEPEFCFKDDEMNNPPIDKTVAGRLNSTGISRLYLASTPDVAAIESRAVTGDWVSIAQFKAKSDLVVLDLRDSTNFENEQLMDLYDFFERMFSSPQADREDSFAIAAHWLVEYFQFEKKINAITYNSSIRGVSSYENYLNSTEKKSSSRQMYNLCGLNPNQWEIISNSCKKTKVREMSIRLANQEEHVRYQALMALAHSTNDDKSK